MYVFCDWEEMYTKIEYWPNDGTTCHISRVGLFVNNHLNIIYIKIYFDLKSKRCYLSHLQHLRSDVQVKLRQKASESIFYDSPKLNYCTRNTLWHFINHLFGFTPNSGNILEILKIRGFFLLYWYRFESTSSLNNHFNQLFLKV